MDDAEITRRSSTRRAPGWFLGKCGSITDHWVCESQNKRAMHASNLMIESREPDLPLHIDTLHINTLIGFGP
jgi:hypothetical protein